MKICFISREFFPFFYGGIGTQFYALIKQFYRQDLEVFFITEKPSNFDQTEFEKNYQGITVIFVEENSNMYSLNKPLNYSFQVEQTFQKLCQEQKINLVFVADYAAESFFIFLNRLSGKYRDIPFILELQGATYECLKHNTDNQDNFLEKTSSWNRIQHYMEDFCIPLSDYFIAPSENTWKEVSQRLKLTGECRIIPNSLNREIFHIKEAIDFPAKSEKKTIVYTGRLERRKGVDLLLEAFSSIIADHQEIEVELIIIGQDLFWENYQDYFRNYWEKNISDQRIKERIKFLDHSPQEILNDYLSQAWVAVFPSRWEPFGIVCLEAITLACPVIVSQNTGLIEVVGSNYGISFDQTEGVDGLKSVILQVLQDVDLRNRLATKSSLRAKELLEKDKQLNLEYIEYIKREFIFSSLIPNETGIMNFYRVFEEYDKLCRDKLFQQKQTEADLSRESAKSMSLWEQVQQLQSQFGSTYAQKEQAEANFNQELAKSMSLWEQVQQLQSQFESTYAQKEQAEANFNQELAKSMSLWEQVQQLQSQFESTYAQKEQAEANFNQELAKSMSLWEQVQQLQSQFESTYAQKEQAEADLSQELAKSKSQLQQAQLEIEAMKSSKFWKLRTAWVSLKDIFKKFF